MVLTMFPGMSTVALEYFWETHVKLALSSNAWLRMLPVTPIFFAILRCIIGE